MYGILGEDKSDVATLKVLIRKLANEKVSMNLSHYLFFSGNN
jgi:hypothetical protein